MKRAIALVTESTRRDRTRQGFAAPRPVGAPLTEPAPPPKKDRLRGRCPSESSPGSRAPNPDSSHSNWTILWGQVRRRVAMVSDLARLTTRRYARMFVSTAPKPARPSTKAW